MSLYAVVDPATGDVVKEYPTGPTSRWSRRWPRRQGAPGMVQELDA